MIIPHAHIRDSEQLGLDDVLLCMYALSQTSTYNMILVFLLHMRNLLMHANENSIGNDSVDAMQQAKQRLIQGHYPDIDPASIHTGYHRGHRPIFGAWGFPDIISVHHLHLHVIIEPRPMQKWLKYPAWNPLMWINDDVVFARARQGEQQSSAATPVGERMEGLPEGGDSNK